jgi:hypothetical protein
VASAPGWYALALSGRQSERLNGCYDSLISRMPFRTAQASTELLRRRRAREDRFSAKSVSSMNDTKWREVLVRASRLELWFVAAFICEKEPVVPREFDRQYLRSPLPEVAFERHQIGDWGGMCGPYKDLFWVLFPRRFCYANDCGHKYFRDQRIQELLDDLADLGKLPLEVTDRFVRVYGYKLTAG